ncbi:hypothetical protein CSBG_03493 [Clostridium sp. 7_2_43FAA]|nr:hypothetical protein CSBG_03493 [Clostridium sp. 7_2_43FAA]MBP1866984.1 hypothetical protein [Clostridium tertium]
MKKQTRQKMIYVITIILAIMFSMSLLVSLI